MYTPFVRYRLRSSALLCTLILGFVACQSGDKPTSSADARLDQAPSCLPQYFASPSQLLPLDAVAAATSRDASEITTDHLQGQAQSLINVAAYSWGTAERTKSVTVGAHTMELPYGYHVSLRHLEQLDQDDPVAYFQQTYRSLTEEERKALEARMQAEIQKRIESGELSADEAQLSSDMSGLFTGSSSYEPVTGVGTAAAWNPKTQELAVLSGDVVFHVLADASEDPAQNQQLATRLAQVVLSHCD